MDVAVASIWRGRSFGGYLGWHHGRSHWFSVYHGHVMTFSNVLKRNQKVRVGF